MRLHVSFWKHSHLGEGVWSCLHPSCACCAGQWHPGEHGGSSIPSWGHVPAAAQTASPVTAGGHGAGEKASASGLPLQSLQRATAMRCAPQEPCSPATAGPQGATLWPEVENTSPVLRATSHGNPPFCLFGAKIPSPAQNSKPQA